MFIMNYKDYIRRIFDFSYDIFLRVVQFVCKSLISNEARGLVARLVIRQSLFENYEPVCRPKDDIMRVYKKKKSTAMRIRS